MGAGGVESDSEEGGSSPGGSILGAGAAVGGVCTSDACVIEGILDGMSTGARTADGGERESTDSSCRVLADANRTATACLGGDTGRSIGAFRPAGFAALVASDPSGDSVKLFAAGDAAKFVLAPLGAAGIAATLKAGGGTSGTEEPARADIGEELLASMDFSELPAASASRGSSREAGFSAAETAGTSDGWFRCVDDPATTAFGLDAEFAVGQCKLVHPALNPARRLVAPAKIVIGCRMDLAPRRVKGVPNSRGFFGRRLGYGRSL